MKYFVALAAAAISLSQMPVRAQTVVDRLKDAASDLKQAVKGTAGVVEQKTLHAWRETKEYLSDDPATYRPAAATQLEDLGATITELKRDAAPAGNPVYFTTRLDSLALQQTACSQQLAALTVENIRDVKSIRRADFDTALSWLQTDVELAQREARDLPAAVRR